MNARASSVSETILWLSIVVGAIILLEWYINNFFFGTSTIQKIHEDLRNITNKVNEACVSEYYSSPYNMHMQTGDLNWSSGQICICINCSQDREVKDCLQTFCEHKLVDAQETIKIEEHTQITIIGGEVPIDTNVYEVRIIEQ